jgi:hypothetical protein
MNWSTGSEWRVSKHYQSWVTDDGINWILNFYYQIQYLPRNALTMIDIPLMALKKMYGNLLRHSCCNGSTTPLPGRACWRNLGVLPIISGWHRSTGLLMICKYRNQHCAIVSYDMSSRIVCTPSSTGKYKISLWETLFRDTRSSSEWVLDSSLLFETKYKEFTSWTHDFMTWFGQHGLRINCY